MEKVNDRFAIRLNGFSELLKELYSGHAKHIVTLGAMQKAIMQAHRAVLAGGSPERPNEEQAGTVAYKQEIDALMAGCKAFEQASKEFRKEFQQYIDDTNFALGSFSNLWGGYIENIGVQYMLNSLRKEYGVHTWFQKFKRYWHKSRNVEIDLLALSDTHAYLIEVKNQLKPETFTQVLRTLEKIEDKLPEYAHLIKQPVIVCMHAEEKTVQALQTGNVWILRYQGFDRNNPQDSFEWLRKGTNKKAPEIAEALNVFTTE